MISENFYMPWPVVFILVTYAVQIVMIIFFPVPSAGSTLEMLFKVKKDQNLSAAHPAKSILRSVPKMMVMITATLLVTTAACIPLIAFVFPRVVVYLLLFMEVPPNILRILSVCLLIIGNLMTFAAVRSLRSHVTFHPFGETTRLHRSGIYGYLRNPITVGLAFIFVGFLLALPCAVLLVGFVVFLFNSNYRVRMEEVYLQASFGEEYCRYQNQVGKYFPKIFNYQKGT